MPADYPSLVHSFSPRQDLVDTVIADNVNALQYEVAAVQTVLGSSANSTNPLVSTYSGTWTNTTTTWGTVGARLANIEAGLVNGVPNSPYVVKTGGNTITTASNKALVLQTGTGTLNLLESYSAAAALGFNLDSSGIPKVGTANVVYVGSTDYTNLTTATSNAASAAAAKIPLSTVTTAGDLIVGTGSSTVNRLAIGSNGAALVSNGTTATWATPTDTSKIPLSTVTTAGDLIVASGASAVTRLAGGASGTVLTANGAGVAPSYQALPSNYVSRTNGTVTTAATTSGVVRNIYTATTAPSGGMDGDVWLVYA